jgi:hypothetical protein
MNRQVIKNRIRKVFAYTVTGILFVIISGFLILQMPPVQNYLINRYLKDFTKTVGFPTSVESFSMLWFDRLELDGVKVLDPEGNAMIRADNILINFKLSNLFEESDINIDGIFVDSAHVYLTKIEESDSTRNLNINVFINRINQNFSSGGGGGKTPRINIGEAFINQSQFSYINQDQDSIRNGFDYNHFSLAVDEGQLKSFVALGDTVEFNLKTLIAQDLDTKFSVKQLSTFFRICQTGMEFTGLNLQAGESIVTDTVIFRYGRQLDLNDFFNKVKVHANLKNTIIYPKDLAVFAPGVERIEKPIRLTGVFNGRVSKFKFTNMDLNIGNTRLMGSLDMDGLPNIHETFINLNVKNSRLDPRDLSFLLNERMLSRLHPMGEVNMNGQFLGYPSDFVANGSFQGRLGYIRSDINFKVNEDDFDRSNYSGRLTLSNFDLGTYLNDTVYFQKVNLNGRVSGTGLTQKTADFQLTGTVNSIGIYGYDYHNIVTDARFASGLFRGMVEIEDPNLQLKARGSIDLRDGRNQVRLVAQLDTAYLHKLNLSREHIFLHANVNADIAGLSLDSLQGVANINDLRINYHDQSLSLDRIHVNALRDKLNRSIQIESSLMDLLVKGNFTYSDISRDLKILSREVALNIRNDKQEIDHYYREKSYVPKAYYATMDLTLKDIEPVSELLNLDFDISKNTHVEGKFTSGRTTIFTAYTTFDSLLYEGKTFIGNEADLTVSKIADSTSVLATATVTSREQQINKNLSTKNLLAEAIWNESHIDFGFDADQANKSNQVRLKGAVDFMRDSTLFTMAPSSLKLLERDWMFAPGNYVSIQGKTWHFNNLILTNADQSISANGKISANAEETLTLNVNKLDLSLLDVLSTNKFKGVVDAHVDLNDLYREPSIQNDINIHGLTMNDFLIGNIEGKNVWDTLANKFTVNLFVDREDKRIINLTGDYTPSLKDDPLNMVAKLDKAELKILEPFLKGIVSHIAGTVSGDFSIKGTLPHPLINGEGAIGAGVLMVDYLRTMYRIQGAIGLTPTAINFKDLELTDVYRNRGTFKGAITHNNFFSMFVNLDATFNNFQVLNTTVKDNSLFYGQAYSTGEVNFYGPVNNMKITSTAKTEKNTRVYIPIGGSSSVDKKDFITFTDFKDTLSNENFRKGLKGKIDLTGITFDLNLDVTPDAYGEIIFDQKVGDIIRGRGNGELKLQLDTKGEFNMFGPFEFTEGFYNFTLYNFINKQFVIKRGSQISWYGDPYLGILNINASYKEQASLAPLILDDKARSLSQVRRKYPVEVLLKLEGQMLSPSFNFDIIAQNLPQNIANENGNPVNLDLAFTVFKNKLDEQELYRQVFSLIVLQKFSPPDAFDASGSVSNSVSELLSNQLSHWISQVDEKLMFDLDLGSFEENAFENLQLSLSYAFLDERIRITADGTFNNNATNTPSNTQRNPSSVAGDLTVEYMLTPDGKLRVKMYSRTNQNTVLSSVNNQSTITTGASLTHTQSFNELKDLWRRSRTKRLKEEEAKNTTPEDPASDQPADEQGPGANEDAKKEDEDGGGE